MKTIFIAYDFDIAEAICASTNLSNIIEALCNRFYIQSNDKIYNSISEHQGETLEEAFGDNWKEILKNLNLNMDEINNLFEWWVKIDKVEVV